MGFSVGYNDPLIPNAPLDMIPFGRTEDGGQLGFLTDFGSVKDLALAPIVMVYPMMCSECAGVSLLAKDLKGFMQLMATMDESLFADLFIYLLEVENNARMRENPAIDPGMVENNDGYIEGLRQQLVQHIREAQEDQKKTDLFKEIFGIDAFEDPVKEMVDLARYRKDEITIQTADEVGIVFAGAGKEVKSYNGRLNDAEAISSLLDQASQSQRLRFYRDAFFASEIYDLEESVENSVKRIIYKKLVDDGYSREAQALQTRYLESQYFSWK